MVDINNFSFSPERFRTEGGVSPNDTGDCLEDILAQRETTPSLNLPSITKACPNPLWRPEFSCELARNSTDSSPLPWVFADTSHDTSTPVNFFLTDLETDLDSLPYDATQFQKVTLIFNAVRLLEWELSQSPSGQTCTELISNPVGNCVDMTNLMYAICRHFEIECSLIYVYENFKSAINHVCLGIKDDRGETILIDATVADGMDIGYPAWYEISECEFLAMHHTARGVRLEDDLSDDEALKEYGLSRAVYPPGPIPLLNSIGIYMRQGESALAGQGLADLSSKGYNSAQFQYLLGHYYLHNHHLRLAQQAFENAVHLCPQHEGARKQLEQLTSRQ
ncbi:MAG: hypothetical protein ACD_62C00209G0014 [uncultured bacterium]|nr:MAG: hypothetical protein ACD_62C00209G0014 [uncultured bacterium]